MSSGRFGWPSRTCSSLPRREIPRSRDQHQVVSQRVTGCPLETGGVCLGNRRILLAMHSGGPDLVIEEERRVGVAEPAADDTAQHHLPERQAVSFEPLRLVAEQRLEREEPVQQCDQLVSGQAGPLHPSCRQGGLPLYIVARLPGRAMAGWPSRSLTSSASVTSYASSSRRFQPVSRSSNAYPIPRRNLSCGACTPPPSATRSAPMA